MSRHSLRVVQTIPVPLKQAWDFFSRPGNLQLITPANFQFNVLTKLDDRSIYEGQIIDYTVRPLLNIQVRWRTIITKVEEEVMFIDEQQRGPFRYWQHQHYFRATEKGIEMTDIVHYEVPGWFLGDILNAVVIKRDLQELFKYRSHRIKELFG